MTDVEGVGGPGGPAAGAGGPGGPASGAGGLPVILVPAGALRDPERTAEHFRGQAALRHDEISTPASIRAATAGAEALVVAQQRLTSELIGAIDDGLRLIGRMGIGVDTVDLEAARARGITVYNEPTFGVIEVASHAVALLLAVQRRLWPGDLHVRDGWHGRLRPGPEKSVDEMTVGVIGCGRIGRAVVGMLAPMAGRILVYDPAVAEVPASATRVARLDELLAHSDAVTVHAPLTSQTLGLLGRRELSLLPDGAIVVNTSRGGQVDEDALAEMLVAGRLGGAGLDVFAREPLPLDSPLLAAPNTILTPHSAGYSARAAWRLDSWTVGDAVEWLRTGRLRHGAIVVSPTR
jgi:D-3-phosphoglycerate dehydrogenase / 2-oxoglutarate reductase